MTCRHALTDNQFTQVDTNTQTTQLNSLHIPKSMVADKIYLFDKYQWQGNAFGENNQLMLFWSKYYVKWTMSEFQVTEGVGWI